MSDLSRGAIKRNMIADYLKINGTYELMGAGFTKLDENPNAQTETVNYIHEVTSTSSIESYQTQFPYDSHLIKSQKAVMALYNTGRNHDTGSDAEFEYVRVDLFQPTTSGEGEDCYLARLFRVSNEVSSFSGEGGKKITVSGNLNAVGDFTAGKFDTLSKTFTPGDFAVKEDETDNESSESTEGNESTETTEGTDNTGDETTP